MKLSLHPTKMVTRVCCLMALVALPGMATAEDTNSPRKLTLEERFELQEQRIRDLEKQIQELKAAAKEEKAEKETVTTTSETLPAEAAKAEAQPALTVEDLTSDTFPGSWPMFGTDLRMKLGGYIKTDMLYDFNGTTDKEQFLMSTIPVEGEPEYADDGYFSFFATETRFNLDIRKDTPGTVPIRGFVEGDFWGEGKFRLRHAYLAYGDLLIGQTWTTLSFLESLPFMIDFAAGDALFGGRATQIRYSKNVSERWKLSVALENLSFLGIENPNGFDGKATTQFPLLAFRADYKWKSTWLVMGSSIAQLRWDGGATGPSDEALQIDGLIALRQYLGANDYVSFNASYGKGSGENVIAFAGSDANAVLNANGTLDTMPAFALIVGYWHRWSEPLSSNFSYAYGWLDTPDSRAPFALKRGGILHANLIWDVTKHFSTGIEYMFGQQRTENDAFGSAHRVQTMAKFAF